MSKLQNPFSYLLVLLVIVGVRAGIDALFGAAGNRTPDPGTFHLPLRAANRRQSAAFEQLPVCNAEAVRFRFARAGDPEAESQGFRFPLRVANQRSLAAFDQIAFPGTACAVTVHGDCPDFRSEARENGTVPLGRKTSQSPACERLPCATGRDCEPSCIDKSWNRSYRRQPKRRISSCVPYSAYCSCLPCTRPSAGRRLPHRWQTLPRPSPKPTLNSPWTSTTS